MDMNKNANHGSTIADLQNQSPLTPKEALPDARSPKPEPKPSVDSVNQQSVIRNQQSIELHIEELVIDGFAPDDAERFAGAVERELTRLLSERGIQASLTEDIDVERLAGGALLIRRGERAETTGQRLARTIFTGMTGGLR
jgi:hypothetical protein